MRSKELPVDRVALGDVTLDPVAVLAQAAYLQLGLFTALTTASAAAPDLNSKGALAAATGHLLAKHRSLVAALERRGVDASEAMRPFAESADRYFEITAGTTWYESLTSNYLVGGLLDDFFARLVASFEPDGSDLERVLRGPRGVEEITGILEQAIAADPRLGSRLALWGRRIVGDTLLIARSALPETVRTDAGEARVEPILTELMAEHTRRMDRLGLTA
ncbi:ferritin-like fold-containing protein [Herbiconiux sp. L3-i23]|uniref:ferritin-like fold-containing protein n=1 Tax=Herbiconiux sp. L3-i23 TaxID=2905871 RepID=UPI0020699511|nr:ferritin-like fold-containing protein [Herbiconiux sp. L3-i23]BDI23454.1 hypothetical protein L3i23_22300 [Herbiconiux sp. L3-i23]